jgi:uncharacterized tellurite resistance protein B-like protein
MSPESEWVFVVCGLIAHADGVLDGDECDRLLSMLDETLSGDEYGEWLARLGEPQALVQRLTELPTPPAERHRDLLEQAWQMALIDGERCDAEIAVLEGIAERIGVDSVQLGFWREAWITGERAFSELAANVAVAILGTPLRTDDRRLFGEFVSYLPTGDSHRTSLRGLGAGTVEVAEVTRALAAQPRKQRTRLLRLVASLPYAAVEGEAACARFLAFSGASGLSDDEIEDILSTLHA